MISYQTLIADTSWVVESLLNNRLASYKYKPTSSGF